VSNTSIVEDTHTHMSSTSNNLTTIDVLRLFKDNVIKFLMALIEILPREGDLIMLRVMFETQIPVEAAMQIFSSRILPYADMVRNKDERFFLEGTDLFDGLQREKVSYFKDLWLSTALTADDKEQLWKWFRLFLNLAEKYEKLKAGKQ